MLRALEGLPPEGGRGGVGGMPVEARQAPKSVAGSLARRSAQAEPVQTRMSETGERERVSECLEESPFRLARSFQAPKSWDGFKTGGCGQPEGVEGA